MSYMLIKTFNVIINMYIINIVYVKRGCKISRLQFNAARSIIITLYISYNT